jgi:hypothetical protein
MRTRSSFQISALFQGLFQKYLHHCGYAAPIFLCSSLNGALKDGLIRKASGASRLSLAITFFVGNCKCMRDNDAPMTLTFSRYELECLANALCEAIDSLSRDAVHHTLSEIMRAQAALTAVMARAMDHITLLNAVEGGFHDGLAADRPTAYRCFEPYGR